MRVTWTRASSRGCFNGLSLASPHRSTATLLASITAAAFPACGSRTSLDLIPPTPTFIATRDSGRTDASPHRVSDSGPLDARGCPTPDAAPRDAPSSPTPDSGLASADATAACQGGPWVLFSLETNEGPPLDEIYARHPDGSGGHVVVLPHVNVTNPSVAPDGSSIVYQSPTDGTLYVYRFGAASDVALATGPIGPNGASLSPDGALVVFTSENGIAVVPADGTGAPQNVGSLHGGSAPVFTEDSQAIVFKTDNLIESARVDSGNVAVLVDTGGDPNAETAISNPAFSPDYESLAAVVICGPGQYAPVTLRTYSFASLPAPCTGGRVVTAVRGGALSWGPTGLIAYADEYDLFLVSATGGTPTNLTSDLTATARWRTARPRGRRRARSFRARHSLGPPRDAGNRLRVS
jgi:hypothetical protein